MLVNIDVPDLAAATRFYTAALDLRVGRHLGPTITELVGLAAPIYLIESTSHSYARHWTPVHLDFTVPVLEAARDRAVAAGGVLERDIESHAWGRIARFADPFGHGFCLVEFSERGYDAIAT